MAKIIIAGGGVCGLGAALLLARDGHQITVIEKDSAPTPSTPQEAWDHWSRRGVAQFHQPHNFMPAIRLLLEDEMPDVLEVLRQAGASRFDLFHPHPFASEPTTPSDERLWSWTARRPVGEWVFSVCAASEPGVSVLPGVRVAALLPGRPLHDGVPHVCGVQTEDGRKLSADLVIDATGRGSRSPRWLNALGATVREEQSDCGFSYFTRYFSGSIPVRLAPVQTSIGTMSVLTLPGDNDTWSVTIFASSADSALKGLRDPERWTQVISACPLHAHWLKGEPITEIVTMSGIVDRYRHFADENGPVVTGLVALADAWACTNPSAGRGIAIGLKQARLLRDVLREAAEDPRALGMEYHRATEMELAPWYHSQIRSDRARFAEMEALREGREPAVPTDELSRRVTALFMGVMTDPELYRAALEYVATLTPLHEVLARPEIRERLDARMGAAGPARTDSPPGPTREELLKLAGA